MGNGILFQKRFTIIRLIQSAYKLGSTTSSNKSSLIKLKEILEQVLLKSINKQKFVQLLLLNSLNINLKLMFMILYLNYLLIKVPSILSVRSKIALKPLKQLLVIKDSEYLLIIRNLTINGVIIIFNFSGMSLVNKFVLKHPKMHNATFFMHYVSLITSQSILTTLIQ